MEQLNAKIVDKYFMFFMEGNLMGNLEKCLKELDAQQHFWYLYAMKVLGAYEKCG
jgi:hypothetical protein